jgi:hypothetical protein
VLESYQNKVFSDITANLSGMTSTAKYAPLSKICFSSSGIKCLQTLFEGQLDLHAVSKEGAHCKKLDVIELGPGAKTL